MAPVPGIPILTAVPPDPAQGPATAINKKIIFINLIPVRYW